MFRIMGEKVIGGVMDRNYDDITFISKYYYSKET